MAQNKCSSRQVIKVHRFQQRNDECAIASVATIANYYDDSLTYSGIRRLVSSRQRKEGMYSPEQGALLNKLGFSKITIVSYDLELFDYGWNRYTNRGKISRLEKAAKYLRVQGNIGYAKLAEAYITWLSDVNCDNQLVIDNDIATYLKRSIKQERPVGVLMNWTSMYKWTKGSVATGGDIKNYASYHAMVARGFDSNNVYLVDPDSYRKPNGLYTMKWSKFLTTANELLIVG